MSRPAASGAAKATKASDGQPVATQLSDGQPGVSTKTVNAVSLIQDGQVRGIANLLMPLLSSLAPGASNIQSSPADFGWADPTAHYPSREPDM